MIDKVNIISHHVYNGRMRLWSPYLDYNKGIDYINAANLLPIPTGETIKIEIDTNYNVVSPENIAQLLLIKDVYKHLLGEDSEKYKLISDYIELQTYGTAFLNSLSKEADDTKYVDFVPTEDQIIYLTHIFNIFGPDKTNIISSSNFTIEDLKEAIKFEASELLKIDISTELEPYKEKPSKFTKLILTKNDVLILALLLLDNPSTIKVLPGLPSIDIILSNIINSHNLYLNEKNSNIQREAYENFVSKTIWNISADPRNWIQGLISVDTSTGPWKTVANNTPLGKESSRFIGASVVGTFKLLTLTLEGKLNVGIVANSLKTLEAISHSIYKTLVYGTTEEILKLFFELKIHNKTIRSVANAWVNSTKFKELPSDVLDILRTLDLNTDAFIELSSLLSLAVDNAKDPTLSKINGNLNMIGLYTTGIILGVSKEELIDIINSKTGRLVSELMLGNIFNNKTGFNFFNEVIDYIFNGPKVSFNDKNLKALYENGIQNLDISELIEKLKSLLNSLLDKKNKDEDAIKNLRNTINKLYKYHQSLLIIKWDTYETTEITDDGEVVRYNKRWWDLYRLMKVNNELKLINKGTSLNQGLENSVEGLLQSLHDLSLILSQMVRNKSRHINKDVTDSIKSKLGNTFVVDMVKFLSDESYRNIVFDSADALKHVTNPYKVFWDVAHYRGYIESLATVIEGSKLISQIYKATVTLYPYVIQGFSLNKLEKLKMIKNIEEFYHRKRNKLFFEYLGKLFTFTYLKNGVNISGITLNSESNRKKFKTIVEQEVLPILQLMFKTNSFILSSEFKINTRTVDHNADVMIGSNISTRLDNPTNKLIFLQAKLDIYKLLNQLILGAPVISVLFAYNLIACDNLNVPYSLSPFFEDLRLTNLSSFILSYDNFVKNPVNINGEPITDFIDDLDIIELKKYCAPIRPYFDKDKKSELIYVWDKSTKSYNLYTKSDDDSRILIDTNNTLFSTSDEGLQINISIPNPISYNVIVTEGKVVINSLDGSRITKYDALFDNVTITSITDVVDLISKFEDSPKC